MQDMGLPDMPLMRSKPMPLTLYTSGDTSRREARVLVKTPLMCPPSRLTRRYVSLTEIPKAIPQADPPLMLSELAFSSEVKEFHTTERITSTEKLQAVFVNERSQISNRTENITNVINNNTIVSPQAITTVNVNAAPVRVQETPFVALDEGHYGVSGVVNGNLSAQTDDVNQALRRAEERVMSLDPACDTFPPEEPTTPSSSTKDSPYDVVQKEHTIIERTTEQIIQPVRSHELTEQLIVQEVMREQRKTEERTQNIKKEVTQEVQKGRKDVLDQVEQFLGDFLNS